MSTILKALRRLEQEKSTQSDRPLGEAVANTPAPPAAARGISPWLVAGLSLAVAFTATVATFWLLSSDEAAPPAESVAAVDAGDEAIEKPRADRRPAQTRPEIAARREAARRAQAARAKRAAAELPAAALTSDVAVLAPAPIVPTEEEEPAAPAPPPPTLTIRSNEPPRPGLAAFRPDVTGIIPSTVSPQGARAQPVEASMPTAQEIAEIAAASEAGDPVPEIVVAARETAPIPVVPKVAAPEPPKTAAPEVVAPPAPAPEVVAAVVEEPKSQPSASPPRKAPVAKAPAPKPVVSKPAVSKRKAAPPPEPEVFVARTVWHPIADRRVAVVEFGGNGEAVELREGDLIGPLVVGEIEPSGVYFTNNGVELRRRVGER